MSIKQAIKETFASLWSVLYSPRTVAVLAFMSAPIVFLAFCKAALGGN